MSFDFATRLSEAGRARFEQRLRTRTLAPAVPVLVEGATCESLLFVERGALRVFKSASNGKEITLYRVRPGELCILSLAALLAGTPYSAAVAADPGTIARELDASTFRDLYASEPELQRFVATQLHRLLAEVMALVSEVAFRRVDARLAGVLLREAIDDRVSTTHEQLAQHLGTAREVVSRVLENLSDDGVVALERGAVRVVRRHALEAAANTS
ncbi:MAG: Crp/Fnr family transcriptional regulator [Archangium sp.]|nr:Crp/Fnr family transcriptional regulator [Archangium sp.]